MDYRLDVTDKAKAQIAALPPELAATVPDHFAKLAAAPVTLSIPGAPPASLPDRQIYPYRLTLGDGREYTVRVHFKYHQDEERLLIMAVTAILHKSPPQSN
jgi:hypothetical protein